MSKRALDLGHIRFGQEANMAEVVEAENVETQDCEKCQRPKKKICAKNLKSTHVCGKLVDQSIKTGHGGHELWMSYVKNLTYHLTVLKNNYIALGWQ